MVNGKLWTVDEDEYLKDCYSKPGGASTKLISRKLNRTEQAVTSRAAYLGLNRIPYYMTNDLTPREFDVYGLLLTDLTCQQIATELGVAKSTVMTHVKSIYAKNYVNSRKQLKEKHYESRIDS